MARQKFEKSFNTFVKGLMTEASEINFPENYSLYEKNFELRRDGGRDRRKGMGLLYPLGVTLTSNLYPLEFSDGVVPGIVEPYADRKTALKNFYIDDSERVGLLPPSIDVLSETPVSGRFLGSGAANILDRERDYEEGPVAEQDPSLGMDYQEWRSYIKDGAVWVEADNTPPRILYESSGELTDISIAFNQNGDLHYVYVEDGVAKFRWFDTATSQFETMILPEGVRTPKITLVDKRTTQTSNSDIILSYIKADHGLYYRQQRDRFQIERLIHPGPFVMIRQMYMNTGRRLQWLLVPGVPIT